MRLGYFDCPGRPPLVGPSGSQRQLKLPITERLAVYFNRKIHGDIIMIIVVGKLEGVFGILHNNNNNRKPLVIMISSVGQSFKTKV